MFDLLRDLDPEQRAVAECTSPTLRVLAGAGTGKTTALTCRVARLVSTGVPAERVLLLTFTRRAARQMVSRTATLLERHGERNRRSSGRVTGGTFHSVAHRTLRRHASRLGITEGFGVLDPADAADLIDVVRQDCLGRQVTKRRFPRKATLIEIYSRAVDTSTPLSEVIPLIAPWSSEHVEAIADICRGYIARKRSLGLLDFDDLLLHWRQALLDERVGPDLAAQFDHVLVDEYQDVNALQVQVLRALTSAAQHLTVVGDDAQSIYSFRASTPRHILEFEQEFPGAQTLRLSANYRSSPRILAVANTLAADAPAGFSTRLRAAAGESASAGRPALVRCADEDAQSDAICTRVLELRESGIALKEQAVLMRAAHHSDRLELELGRRGIPFVKYGGLRYLEAAHVKDLLAGFRLADNPRDELSWFRLLQLLDGVGPATARRAIGELGLAADAGAQRTSEDAEVLLRWPLACEVLPPAVRSRADAVAAAVSGRSGEPVAQQAERIRQAITPLIESAYPDAAARRSDLDALVDAAGTAPRLCEVAAEHALEPPRSTGDLAGPPSIDEDWLVLSTVHSAKGLEWDAVHLLHAADGNFPSDMALGSREGLEEERRLFYVAVTRPRRHLAIYVPLRYHHHPRARDDRHSWAQPSRFLSEPVRACLDESTLVRPDTGSSTVPEAAAAADTTAAVDASLDALWT